METVLDILLYLILIYIGFGVFVIEHNPRSKQNLSFALIMFGTAIWVAGFYLLHKLQVFYWPDKITHFGGLLLVAGFYTFSLVFPRELRKVTLRRSLVELSGLILILLILPLNLIVTRVDFNGGQVNPVNGPMFPVLMLIESGYAVAILRNIYLQFKINSGINRERILYVLLGLALFMVLGLISDVVLPEFRVGYFKFVGPYSSIFFALLSSISIISFRLMDVRVLTKNILINLISLAAVIWISAPFNRWESQYNRVDPRLFALLFSIPVFIFWLIKTFLNEITKKFFLKKYYRSRDLFNELNIKLNHELDSEQIIFLVREYLLNALQLKWITFVDTRKAQSQNIELEDFITVHGRPFYVHSSIHDEMFRGYSSLPIAVLPLLEEGRLVGYFVLGPQNGIVGLSLEQIQRIDAAWAHLQTAFARSKLYEGLEQKVATQVRDLTFKNKQLNAVMKSRVEFLQMISHQLKSPITSLSGALELVNQRKLGEEDNREMLAIAYEKSKDLSESFTSILNLAKLQRGSASAEIKSTVNVNEIFNNILKVLAPQAEAKNMPVVFLPAEFPLVVGNKIYLEQAFFNVLENAIIHNGTGSIHIDFQDEPEFVIARVADTGQGIPVESQDKIFKKDVRGKESRGSGMGLYIVRSIINAHPKGHIWFESTVGVGTTFYIRLLKAQEVVV